MEKLEILKEIHKQQVIIEEQLNKITPDLKEYKEFFEKYETSTLRNISQIDTVDLAIFLTKSSSPETFDLDKIGYIYEMNREIFENFTIYDFNELLGELSEIYETDEETANQLLDDMKKSNIFNKKTDNDETSFHDSFSPFL